MKTQNIIALCASMFLLLSAKAEDSTNSPAQSPSSEQTVIWIQSHIDELAYSDGQSLHEEVKAVQLENGKLIFWIKAQHGGWPDYTAELHKISFDLSEILGEVKLITRQDYALIVFNSNLNKITTLQSRYYQNNKNTSYAEIDGEKVAPIKEDSVVMVELKRLIEQGKEKEIKKSEYSIYVTGDYAPRMKKAFDHLIQLHGGGKPEAF